LGGVQGVPELGVLSHAVAVAADRHDVAVVARETGTGLRWHSTSRAGLRMTGGTLDRYDRGLMDSWYLTNLYSADGHLLWTREF
jgi:hypothetical protein